MTTTVTVIKGGEWRTIKQREDRKRNFRNVASGGLGLAGAGSTVVGYAHKLPGEMYSREVYDAAKRGGKKFAFVRAHAAKPKGRLRLAGLGMGAAGLGIAAGGGVGMLHENRKINQRRKANAARASERAGVHDRLRNEGVRRGDAIFTERQGKDGEIMQTHSGYKYDRQGKITKIGKAAPMTPAQRDQRNLERATSQKRQAQFGLANNAFGAAAGGLATAQAFHSAPKNMAQLKATKMGGRLVKLNRTKVGAKILKPLRKVNPKAAVLAGGAGLVGMQAVNGAMDAQSGAYFARQSRETAQKQKKIEARIERRSGTPGVASKSYEQLFDVTTLSKSDDGVGRNLLISKRVRRFDPEGDRQRRLGIYQGAGAAGAAAGGIGGAVLSHNAWQLTDDTEKLALRKLGKRVRLPAAVLAGAGASGGLAVAAHRRANSARNQRWT